MELRSKRLGNVLTKFLWADIGLTILLMVNIVIVRVAGAGEAFLTYDIIVSVVVSVNVVIYTIMYLFWLFKVHKDLQALDEFYPITPGGAIARVLIPIYNIYGLWNVYSTMADYFKKNSSVHTIGSRLALYIPIYYFLMIATTVLSSYLSRQSTLESFSALWFTLYLGDGALVVMYILIIKAVSIGLLRLSEHDLNSGEADSAGYSQ
ncbi:hypothetical protein LF817_13215 [Halobacillus sp. A1]|uniref:hypothetical protein n=1 Tax=Halobacillus sp. A1 TaxID=2880262 RepID=UPI0020A69AF0|nr:hypothetical protein [Halobacillus sp. A1]MCP3032301.1 hypothetical protein [Halobacillus sp. A1]